MAGIAVLLDLWRKNQSFNPGLYSARTYQSTQFFSASAAATAASLAAGSSFASRALFGSQVAYSDAGVALPEDYISNIQSASEKLLNHDALQYSSTKQYNVQLKPLFSAFELRTLALTSLRSFLLYYLPLLEPRANMEDDDDFLEDNQEENHVDLVVPFKKSVIQIIRESTVVTTRRILERISVHHVSQRMAWKLLKDIPQSAVRKAGRKMPTLVYIYCVSRTTFRGHMLGVAASWIVQVGIDVYRFFTSGFKTLEEDDDEKQVGVLGQKVFVATVRCISSLIFASIGAGIGAAIIRPSRGQWIGCAAGDLAGPIIVAVIADKVFHVTL
ncbi:uncharacterized protein LOC129313309 [Prosopis cineraria]|uniref:uncharacterized protein LOC129313309 n=1 Tax=Prosopis cineraria TaxID=364024 RepID=UPI00240ECEEE|nr:uncharacterized protein LOC129313309 [Prosopis cineraria]